MTKNLRHYQDRMYWAQRAPDRNKTKRYLDMDGCWRVPEKKKVLTAARRFLSSQMSSCVNYHRANRLFATYTIGDLQQDDVASKFLCRAPTHRWPIVLAFRLSKKVWMKMRLPSKEHARREVLKYELLYPHMPGSLCYAAAMAIGISGALEAKTENKLLKGLSISHESITFFRAMAMAMAVGERRGMG